MAADAPPDTREAQLEAEVARLRARVSALTAEAAPIDPALRSIADNSPDNIMLLDRQGRIRFINHTVPDLTVEQVLGTQVYEHVPEAYADTIRQTLERVARTGQPDGYDTAYITDDGQISYWESRVGPVWTDGVVTGFAVTSSNASERRKADLDRDRFFNLALDILCVASFEGYFLRINPAFTRVLGHSEDALLGRPFVEFIHDDDRDATRDAVAALREGQMLIDFENRCRTSLGDYRWLSWRAVADLKDQRIYAAGRDVTERRLLRDQVRHAQKLEAVGQLAGGIAHDFNNLVLAIQVNADFGLRHGGAEGATAKHFTQIKAAADRAAALTRQLLALGRQQTLALEPMELGAVAADVVALIERLIPENIVVEMAPHAERCATAGDRALLEQVLINLCINARDAMPSGGRLRIETDRQRIDAGYCEQHPWARPGRYVIWRVIDTGVGMHPDVQARAFEPFFTTKALGHGTGLGLATAYGIVQQHRGLMRVVSELGAGATFEIYLPASDARESLIEAPREDSTGGAETILVAEDDEMVRKVVVALLEDAGYTVITARDGVEAVEMYRKYEDVVDVLLLDIVMPRKSGPEALEEIRKLNPDVRAVISSGYGGESEPTGLEARGTVLRKPYKPETLLARLRRELQR